MNEQSTVAAPPMRHARYSIAWREFSAAFSSVVALAALDAVLMLVNVIMVMMERENGASSHAMPGMSQVLAYLSVTAIIVGLCLGVLCGAEEEENATADLARRLPVSRMRIFIEKIAGSFAAFGVWAALAFGMMIMITYLVHGEEGRKAVNFMGEPYSVDYVRALILFTAGLAAGVWIGRVVVAAVVGGIAAFVLANIAMLIFYQLHRAHVDYEYLKSVNFWVYLGISALFLILAAIRFQTREGR